MEEKSKDREEGLYEERKDGLEDEKFGRGHRKNTEKGVN